MRILFCLPTATLSGGVKIIFELANRLIDCGCIVDIFSYARSPQWFVLKANLIDAKEIEAVDVAKYDFVIVSNAFMVPLVLAIIPIVAVFYFVKTTKAFIMRKAKTLMISFPMIRPLPKYITYLSR